MNKFCVGLNLNGIPPLIKDIDSYGPDHHKVIPLEDINPDMILFLDALNVKVTLAETFYTNPFTQSDAHIDVIGGDYTKINFIYGGKKSRMLWYKIKEDVPKRHIQKTVINTQYISFKLNELEKIHEEYIVHPSLVQVGIPHNIINLEEHRRCISLVIKNKITNTRIKMDDAIKIFEPCLL